MENPAVVGVRRSHMVNPRSHRTSGLFLAFLVAVLGQIVGGPVASASPVAPRHEIAYRHAGDGHHRGRYVALGDSFSSGEGTGVYFPNTDTPANRCHRSPIAYGPLLRYSQRHLGPLSFVACSSALTEDLYFPNHAYPTEAPQLSALGRQTKAVSITIGGNDAGFALATSACVQSVQTQAFGCSEVTTLNAAINARLAALAGAAQSPPGAPPITPIKTVLKDIQARAPRATIYLAGYPELFGAETTFFSSDPTAPSTFSCVLNSDFAARVDFADAQWFNLTIRRLNTVLRNAVRQARQSGVRAKYVSASTFDGHGLCDAKTSWIQPVLVSANQTPEPRPESLHPTATGQSRGYERAFRRAGL
jgi:hypothetical protein